MFAQVDSAITFKSNSTGVFIHQMERIHAISREGICLRSQSIRLGKMTLDLCWLSTTLERDLICQLQINKSNESLKELK